MSLLIKKAPRKVDPPSATTPRTQDLESKGGTAGLSSFAGTSGLSSLTSHSTSQSLPDGEYIINRQLPRCRRSRQVTRSVLVANLPALRDAPPTQRGKLLTKKLRLCCYTFEFQEDGDSVQDAKDKELKRTTLMELISYLSVFKPSFTDDQLADIFEMLQANLFRPLPANSLETQGSFNPEEDEPLSESTWPHLQGVYEFLLRLATATETDPKLLDKYFSQNFVLGLLELFDSEDPRERDYLKTILHRIYGNFMSLRPFIRRAINNVFFRLIYETDRHNGVAELLEILGSIINGFALPLKDQHKQFLVKVLLPLHKVSHVAVFHPQLSYCVTQFLEKDPTLAPKIVNAILRQWPSTTSKKELMFLNELEEVLDRVQSRHLAESQIPLFTQLARCIRSPHFQVSERALYILNNDIILRFMTIHRQALLPLLADALFSNTHLLGIDTVPKTMPPKGDWVPGASTRLHGHWSSTVVELTADILKLFTEMDASVMRACKDRFDQMVQNERGNKALHKQRWDQILNRAAPSMHQLGLLTSNNNGVHPVSSGPHGGTASSPPPHLDTQPGSISAATAAGYPVTSSIINGTNTNSHTPE